MPNFSQASVAEAAPIYQGAVDTGNAAQAAQQQMIDAATGIGGMAMMSDRRMKSNIKRIGTKGGYPWYSYNLKHDGSAHEGVMADEIPAQFTIDIGGYKAVDYGRLLGEVV